VSVSLVLSGCMSMVEANAMADNAYPSFSHVWCVDNAQTLVRKVDEVIGFWPADASFLVFQHTDERHMQFAGINFVRSGMWTDVLTAQDYYAVKLGLGDYRSYLSGLAAVSHAVSTISNVLVQLKPPTRS
jgi:hypothetical protein